jgi:ribosomal protein S19
MTFYTTRKYTRKVYSGRKFLPLKITEKSVDRITGENYRKESSGKLKTPENIPENP